MFRRIQNTRIIYRECEDDRFLRLGGTNLTKLYGVTTQKIVNMIGPSVFISQTLRTLWGAGL
jgi:hypothetical protein